MRNYESTKWDPTAIIIVTISTPKFNVHCCVQVAKLMLHDYRLLNRCTLGFSTDRLGRVTSMTVTGGLLYVGTGGGALLALDCSTMDLHFVFHAYVGPVRSLLIVLPEQQTRAFTRLFSRKDSVLSSINTSSSMDDFGPPPPVPQAASARRRSSLDSLMSMTSRRSLRSLDSTVSSERSVLISFGVGYRGVVGESENCPSAFTLPSDGKKILTKPAKPCAKDGHLLLWSTERCGDYPDSPRLTAAGSFLADDVISECDEVT